MSWDWQRLLEEKDAEPSPGDPSFGAPMVETPEQAQRPADTGAIGQAESFARGAAGMIWHPAGRSGMTGGSLTKGDPPQLLYGQEHKCAYCRGTGQMHGANRCPVCGGSGRVKFTPPAVRCAFCYGGGHVPPRSETTCTACRGSGVIKVRPPIRICAKCKGRGKQKGAALYCARCQGSGVVTVSEAYDSAGRGARERAAGDEADRCGHPGGPRKQEQACGGPPGQDHTAGGWRPSFILM